MAAPSVKFSHKKHLDEASCKDCHTKVKSGFAIPNGKKCVECHDEAEGHGPKDFYKQAKKDCKTCHVEHHGLRRGALPRKDPHDRLDPGAAQLDPVHPTSCAQVSRGA